MVKPRFIPLLPARTLEHWDQTSKRLEDPQRLAGYQNTSISDDGIDALLALPKLLHVHHAHFYHSITAFSTTREDIERGRIQKNCIHDSVADLEPSILEHQAAVSRMVHKSDQPYFFGFDEM